MPISLGGPDQLVTHVFLSLHAMSKAERERFWELLRQEPDEGYYREVVELCREVLSLTESSSKNLAKTVGPIVAELQAKLKKHRKPTLAERNKEIVELSESGLTEVGIRKTLLPRFPRLSLSAIRGVIWRANNPKS